jgi:hypothetical protein
LAPTKYWRRQNIGVYKIIGVDKNIRIDTIIGVDKNIRVTIKTRRQQNLGADKNLVSTKYIRQQNIGVDKILPRTKSWCRHRSVSLLLGSAESAAADFSQAPLISYFSLMVLLSLHAVVK